ncbi:MAG TPA: hypothetical protein VF746_07370 [Longimicrobium sp.]|jgi:hypothetical protein
MLRRLAPALLLACAACTSEQASDGAAPGAASAFQSPGDAARASSEAYLVWSADSAHAAETAWIDGEGRVVARRPGVFVAGGGGVWRWTEGKQMTTGLDCECLREKEYAEGAQCPARAEVATVDLVDLLGGRRVRVLDAPNADSLEIAPPEQWATPLAGAGPYLFVETRTDVFACGAHGSLGVEAAVYDLASGARVALLDSAEAAAALAREGEAARARLNRAEEMRDSPADAVDLTEVEARWTPAGELEVAYQFTAGACYACSDGHSSSYSRSEIVPASRVPGRLAAWTRAPEAVRRYWRAAPPLAESGWSRVDAADPAAALARFRGP